MDKNVSKYKEKSKKYFDKIADDYFNTWDGQYSKQMYSGILKTINMQPFASILDVGCGTGELLSRVIKQNADVIACGIDISEIMLNKALQKLGQNVQLILGDADNLPWDDQTFDLVICNASFHHYPEAIKVLIEIKRILRTNGRIIICDPWWPDFKRLLINWYLKTPFNLGGDVRIYSEQEFRNMLMKSGFLLIEYKKPTNEYCLVVATA